MDILEVFRAQGTQLFWQRLDDDAVSGRPSGELIEPNRHYVTVRLAEMYLGRSRTLWRKFSPLLHSFTTAEGGHEEHSVAGPGQLQQLGEDNLDRVVILNMRVGGPVPYVGGGLSVVAGLYSVPGEDAAAALINTLGTLSGLISGGTTETAKKIVDIVKGGIDSVLHLGNTRLRLGVLDTFGGGNPLRSGFHIAIGAPHNNVVADELSIDDGRLRVGGPLMSRSYTAHDYFVIYLERADRRPDWPGLSGIEPLNEEFQAILSAPTDVAGKRQALNQAWPRFTEVLKGSPQLTRFDADAIAAEVGADIQARLDAMAGGGRFETKAWGSDEAEIQDPRSFDLASVPTNGDAPEEPWGARPF